MAVIVSKDRMRRAKTPGLRSVASASGPSQPQISPGTGLENDPVTQQEPGYLVICWDDPVNLMDYVTHVFQMVFGWKKARAEKHMLEVHNQGKSVLARECLEKAEFYVHELHKYNLHATMERDSA